MKFSFFSPKATRADIEREAQQELEAAMNRAQPPTDAQRTWVLPQQEMPDFRTARPAPAPPRRRAVRPLLGPQAPPFPPPAERPAPDDFEDVPFGDEQDVPLDQVPLGSVFDDGPRAAPPRPAAPAPRKRAASPPPGAAGSAGAAPSQPKATRPRQPGAAAAKKAAPRSRPATGQTPPTTRRRPPT